MASLERPITSDNHVDHPPERWGGAAQVQVLCAIVVCLQPGLRAEHSQCLETVNAIGVMTAVSESEATRGLARVLIRNTDLSLKSILAS